MSDHYGKIPISFKNKKTSPPPPEEEHEFTPEPEVEQIKETSKRSRYFLLPFILLLLFAAYYGLSSLLVPLLITKKGPDFFYEKTGLSLEVGSAKFNPLNCALKINEIAVSSVEDGSITELLSVASLFADLDFTSLLRNGFVSDRLEINGPKLNVRRNTDKSYNFSQLISKFTNAPVEELELADLPFLYSLNNISLTDGTLIFNDLLSQKTHKVEEIQLSLPTFSNFSFDANNYIQPRFSAIINGSPIELVSEQSPHSTQDNGAQTLSISLKSLDISLYANFLPISLPFSFKKGITDGKLQISFLSQKDQSRHLILNYQLAIKDLLATSIDGAITLSTPILNVEGALKPLTGDIDLASLLIREPELTIKTPLSPTTLSSIALSQYTTNTQNNGTLRQPSSLNISLLIADNGKIVLQDKKTTRTFSSIQVSMRNYANLIAISRDKATSKGTFNLSGELDKDYSTFSWQGNFENGKPTGSLEFNNLQLADFLYYIGNDANIQSEGSMNIRGTLTTAPATAKRPTPSLFFTKGTILATQVALFEKKKKWFQDPSVKFSDISYRDGTFNLGNIVCKKADLTIQPGQRPGLLELFTQKGKHSITGIDLKGNISFLPENTDSTPFNVSNIHLQISNLDKKKNKSKNFAFSGSSQPNGTIKMEGLVALGPVRGDIDLAFSGLKAGTFLSRFSSDKYTVEDETLLNGKGSYNLSQKRFSGDLEVMDGTITDLLGKRKYQFSKGLFSDFSFGPGQDDYEAAKIMLQKFKINSEDLQVDSDKVYIESLSKKKKALTIAEISMANSTLFVEEKIPSLVKSIVDGKITNFSLKKLSIDGKLGIINSKKERISLFDEYELKVENLGDENSKKENISLKAKVGSNGKIRADGFLFVNPLSARLQLKLTDVDNDNVQRFYSVSEKHRLHGILRGDVLFSYPDKTYTGDITVSNGKISKNDDSELLHWRVASFNNFNLIQSPYNLKVDKLDLESPECQFTTLDTDIITTINGGFDGLIGGNLVESGNESTAKITIANLNISNGKTHYFDKRLTPHWQSSVDTISGKIKNFILTDASNNYTFDLQGKLANSPFTLKGGSSHSPVSSDIAYTFDLNNFPLSKFDKQIENVLKINTDKATFNLSYQKKSDPTDLTSNARFTFSSFEVDEKSKDTSLLLALLTDNKNIFTQDIEIKKSKKGFFEQSVNHFQKLLVKSSFSPYLLLPSPYISLKNNNQLTFPPGKSSLDTRNRDNITQYANLLKVRPSLQLMLEAVVHKSKDAMALKKQLESEEKIRVNAENIELLQKWKESHNKAFESVPAADGSIVVEDIPTNELEAFTPISPKRIVITDDMLVELGKKRIETVYMLLVNEFNIPLQKLGREDEIILSDSSSNASGYVAIGLAHAQKLSTLNIQQ